ncbi:hypothetical protein J2TS6_50600 [Paenibacillus albilobatus]|uniref:Uncharacterized protein n=1 Tax=Paenibacillus albilobatus TaxID=2716884 RepID=A0A919XJL7_9BACL|nr:hypothetical protein J2TS6_50600 [Paenibacillus albilobatus]
MVTCATVTQAMPAGTGEYGFIGSRELKSKGFSQAAEAFFLSEPFAETVVPLSLEIPMKIVYFPVHPPGSAVDIPGRMPMIDTSRF